MTRDSKVSYQGFFFFNARLSFCFLYTKVIVQSWWSCDMVGNNEICLFVIMVFDMNVFLILFVVLNVPNFTLSLVAISRHLSHCR